MDKKININIVAGVILILIAIEQFIADVTKLHMTLNSWLYFIIFLLGIFFIERAYKQIKKNKQKNSSKDIDKQSDGNI